MKQIVFVLLQKIDVSALKFMYFDKGKIAQTLICLEKKLVLVILSKCFDNTDQKKNVTKKEKNFSRTGDA